MLGLQVDLEVIEIGLVQLDATLSLSPMACHFVERFHGVCYQKNVGYFGPLGELCRELLKVVLAEQNAEWTAFGKVVFAGAFRELQVAGGPGHHQQDEHTSELQSLRH